MPSKRDTAAWRLGLHMEPLPLRAVQRADPLPKLVALTAVLAGFVNLAAAVRPNIAWRNHLLLGVEPLEGLKISHAAAVPTSLLLLVTAPYLWRRRQSALRLALVLLTGLTALDLLKGLDLEAAFGSAAAATVLWLGRGSFYVRHDPATMRVALRRVPLLAGAVAVLCGIGVWLAAHGDAGLITVVRETGDAFLWQQGPLQFRDELAHLDEAIGVTGLITLAWCAYLLFRPLAAPRLLPDAERPSGAGALVRSHGSDTLAYFKLRHDQHYLFGRTGGAFLGYRVEAGVLLVSGDPVGPADALPDLLRELHAFASQRGLRVAALGVGGRLLPLWQDLGLRSFYLGDEAVVDTARFSLDGRASARSGSRSRGSRSRDTRRACGGCPISPTTIWASSRLSATAGDRASRNAALRCRSTGYDERITATAWWCCGLDADERIRGFLHFAPSYGRAAASLSLMRRDHDTPNGLTEFLVARGIELLRIAGSRRSRSTSPPSRASSTSLAAGPSAFSDACSSPRMRSSRSSGSTASTRSSSRAGSLAT